MIAFRYKAFFEVARQLSFSKASTMLNISQPAISKHIKSLEEEYKTSLFERKGNSIALTKAGQVLYDYLQETSRVEKQLAYDLSTISHEQQAKGHLSLGASTTMALYVLPKILADYHQQFPQITFSVINRNAEHITQALIDKIIDLGIAEGYTKLNEISYVPFIEDEIVLVSAREGLYAQSDGISIDQLFSLTLASREVGSGTLYAVKKALMQQQYNPKKLRVSVTLGGTEALKNFIRTSSMMGFLPIKAITRELENKELFIIPVKGLTVKRQFYFMQRQGETNPYASQFIKFTANHYNLRL